MISTKDLNGIIGNIITNNIGKILIRNSAKNLTKVLVLGNAHVNLTLCSLKRTFVHCI